MTSATIPHAWLLPSNSKMFDTEAAFRARREVDWSEATSSMEVGDTVFIYATRPIQALSHECVVTKTGIPRDSVLVDDRLWNSEKLEDRASRTWMRLRLVRTFSTRERELLGLQALQEHGLNGAPMGRWRVPVGVMALVAALPSMASTEDALAEHGEVGLDEIAGFERDLLEGRYAVQDRYGSRKIRGSAQRVFARAVKRNYGYRCAVTGVVSPEFLVASHIVPWAEDADIRLDPSNGICLSLLVDRAFEVGAFTLTDGGVVVLARDLRESDPRLQELLQPYEGRAIAAPVRSSPRPAYLQRRRALVESPAQRAG